MKASAPAAMASPSRNEPEPPQSATLRIGRRKSWLHCTHSTRNDPRAAIPDHRQRYPRRNAPSPHPKACQPGQPSGYPRQRSLLLRRCRLSRHPLPSRHRKLHVLQTQLLGNLEVHSACRCIHVGMHGDDGNIILDRLANGALHIVLIRYPGKLSEDERMMAYDEIAALLDRFIYHRLSDVKTQQCPDISTASVNPTCRPALSYPSCKGRGA